MKKLTKEELNTIKKIIADKKSLFIYFKKESGELVKRYGTGGDVVRYMDVEDFKRSNRSWVKTKPDQEFIDLIASIISDLGVKRITSSKHKTQKSGRTIGFQFDYHLSLRVWL